jgi:hypothetical protein
MRTLLPALVLLVGAGGLAPAAAKPVACQRAIAKNFARLAKKTLVGLARCLDKENAGTVAGPCPDPTTAAKLQLQRDKAVFAIPSGCEVGDVAALGFVGGCNFGLPEEDSTVEATCRTLPATTPAEVGICLACWQQADAYEFMALLYASHAAALCDGMPDRFSSVCSAGGCSGTPTSSPDQRDLGSGGEYDCQRGIGKAGVKYLLTRRKVLQKCAVAGGTRTSCLADARIALVLAKAKDKQAAYIETKCGNRDPLPNPPFCCRTMGNDCVAAADRDACELAGGTPQAGKQCGVGGSCENAPGGPTVTWWDSCAPRDCQGFPVTALEDLHHCTEDRADEIVDGMLCTQFPRNGQGDWPCPSSPSGAFLDE